MKGQTSHLQIKKKILSIFNGEIYNYIQIKDQLKNDGIKFNTTSDTEVLFKLIISKGIEKSLKLFGNVFFHIL